MDPVNAVTLMLANHRADLAMAVAARMMQMDAGAAQAMADMIDENAAELERIIAETAAGTGSRLDVSV